MHGRRPEPGRHDRGERPRRILEPEVAIRDGAADDLRRVPEEHVEIAALRPDAEGGDERGRDREHDQREDGDGTNADTHAVER